MKIPTLIILLSVVSLPHKNFQLTWTQEDITGVTGWNVYSNGVFVASTSTTNYDLPKSVPYGACYQVTATNSDTGEESDYSNVWTNTIPKSATNLKRK